MKIQTEGDFRFYTTSLNHFSTQPELKRQYEISNLIPINRQQKTFPDTLKDNYTVDKISEKAQNKIQSFLITTDLFKR